jgi:hypothetical protein
MPPNTLDRVMYNIIEMAKSIPPLLQAVFIAVTVLIAFANRWILGRLRGQRFYGLGWLMGLVVSGAPSAYFVSHLSTPNWHGAARRFHGHPAEAIALFVCICFWGTFIGFVFSWPRPIRIAHLLGLTVVLGCLAAVIKIYPKPFH